MDKRLEELQKLQKQIALEECDRRLQELLKNAAVEMIDGAFVIRGYKPHAKSKGKEYRLPSSQTLASKDFWEIHPFHEHVYRFVGAWLLAN